MSNIKRGMAKHVTLGARGEQLALSRQFAKEAPSAINPRGAIKRRAWGASAPMSKQSVRKQLAPELARYIRRSGRRSMFNG